MVATRCQAQDIVLTNDDGWAVAQIRAQNDALKAAGFNVSLSCCLYRMISKSDCAIGCALSSYSERVWNRFAQRYARSFDPTLRIQYLPHWVSC